MKKKKTNYHCQVRCIETGETFNTLTEAAAAIQRNVSAICMAIKRGGKCGGYHWEKIIEKEFSVYKLTMPNGKVYIGQTNRPVQRRWANGLGYAGNKALTADIEAFGWDNVEHEILERVDTREEAMERERFYILKFESNNPERGYNTTTNLHSFGTKEEKLSAKRAYSREYMNVTNPQKTVICIETGVEYESASEAARQLGLNNSHISEICRGSDKRFTCGGYHWKFGEVKS